MTSFSLPEDAIYYHGRLVKGAPLVGVAVWFGQPLIDGEWLDRSPRWNCLIRNETTSRAILMGDHVPIEIDGITLRNLQQIKREEYLFLVSHSAFSTAHAPHNPDASPTKAIDFNRMKPIF